MISKAIIGLAFATLTNAIARFQCSQLVMDRLDPLVAPGTAPTQHIHQIVGGVDITFSYLLGTFD
jgi:hypothetical protein